jgi:ATP phosphoribosyltransferase regulatory subunit
MTFRDGPGTRALSPPSGVRDLLPEEARARRALARRFGALFASHGYEPVVTPAFEHAEVMERGFEDQLDPRELLRFVEPETGEVALLRPDLTPQVARIVATRLSDRPGPWRMAYQGTVIRRRQGRSRRSRQLAQAGVECIGLAPHQADPEVVGLAVAAARSAGIPRFRVELGHAALAREALDEVRPESRGPVVRALAQKDAGAVEQALADAALRGPAARRIASLPRLHGGAEVLAAARRAFPGPDAREALDAMARVVDVVGARLAPGEELGIDLGELRGVRYYTGLSFSVLAPGPGEAVLAGGRYDRLLERYGMPAPAVGFAIDLEHVEWALARAGVAGVPTDGRRWRVVVAGRKEATVDGLAAALRDAGVDVATLVDVAPRTTMAYAEGWGYDASVIVDAPGRVIRAGGDRAEGTLPPDEPGGPGRDLSAAVQTIVGFLDASPAAASGEPDPRAVAGTPANNARNR